MGKYRHITFRNYPTKIVIFMHSGHLLTLVDVKECLQGVTFGFCNGIGIKLWLWPFCGLAICLWLKFSFVVMLFFYFMIIVMWCIILHENTYDRQLHVAVCRGLCKCLLPIIQSTFVRGRQYQWNLDQTLNKLKDVTQLEVFHVFITAACRRHRLYLPAAAK